MPIIPPDTRAPGQSGHITDHNDISAFLLQLQQQVNTLLGGGGSIGGPLDWLNVVSQYGADPTGQADSTNAINGALTAAQPGEVVYLPAGIYKVSSPLTVPQGVLLLGPVPISEEATKTVPDLYGAVITPTAAFTAVGFTNPGVIYVNGPGATAATALLRPAISNLWVDGRNLPSSGNVHGISLYGNIDHAMLANIGIWGVSGYGISATLDTTTSQALTGGTFDVIIVQSTGGGGIFMHGSGVLMQGVHASSCTGNGFNITGVGNNRFLGCRVNNCTGDGFYFDCDPAMTPDVPAVSNILSGCETLNNGGSGLHASNSSATGAVMRVPIIASGCSFDGDATAGILVTGYNIVTASDCNVTTGLTGTGPVNALATASAGTTPGVPALVEAIGGFWNSIGALINDAAPASFTKYSVHGYSGAPIQSGTAISAFEKNPTGLTLQASSGEAGYTLVNGTGTIISWTAPSDGQLHRVLVLISENITSAATGGAISWTYTDPGGSSQTVTMIGGGQAVGAHHDSDGATIGPGTTVTIAQTGALTLGAGVAWPEIWGS